MATAYLEGGPCDRATHTITAAESDEGVIICKGGRYNVTSPPQHRHGDLVFTFAGRAHPPAVTPPKTHATEPWHRLMKAGLHDLPHAVQRSNEHLRALRRLSRSH